MNTEESTLETEERRPESRDVPTPISDLFFNTDISGAVERDHAGNFAGYDMVKLEDFAQDVLNSLAALGVDRGLHKTDLVRDYDGTSVNPEPFMEIQLTETYETAGSRRGYSKTIHMTLNAEQRNALLRELSR